MKTIKKAENLNEKKMIENFEKNKQKNKIEILEN